MSQGMRNCSKTRVFDANNAGSVVINMNKFHSNTSILIPLYNSNYSNPFNLSLVMSINDFNTVSPNSFEFGKGVRLNLYKNFTVDEPFLRTDNSDFSSNLFVRVDPNRLEFKSSETSDYIIAEYVDTELEYYDQYGNYFVYNRNPLNDPITLVHCKYPTSYYDKGGKRKLLDIVINDDHDISTITSASGEKAVFSKNTNGLVNKIEIKRPTESGDVVYHTINFEYQNGYLYKVIHVLNNNLNAIYSSTYIYDEENRELIVKDNLSKYCLKIEYDSNSLVSKVTEGYNDIYTNGKYYLYNYVSNFKTLETDYNGLVNQYYFELNKNTSVYANEELKYLPIYESLHNTMTRGFIFDHYGGYPLYDSGYQLINNNLIKKNLVNNGYFDNYNEGFILSNEYIDVIQVTDNIFNEDSGGYAILLTEGDFISQDILINGNELTYLTFNVWGRSNYDSTQYGDIQAYVRVYLYNDDNVEEEYTIEFNKYDYWIFKSIGINTSKMYNKIIIKLEQTLSNEFLFTGIALFEKPYEAQYYYNDENRLLKAIKNGKFSGVEYLNNNVNMKYRNGEFINFTYDSNNNVINKYTSKGLNINYTYDDKNNVTKVVSKTDNNIFLESNTLYNENSNLLLNHEVVKKQFDTLNNEVEYNYNLFTRLLESEKCDIVTKSYSYNEFDQIIQNKISISSENEKTLYDYYDGVNENRSLKSLKSNNNNEFVYLYDNKGKLTGINLVNNNSTNTVLSISYINEDTSNSLVHKGLIKSKKYGSVGDEYIFNYDNKDRLRNVYLKKSGQTSQTEVYRYLYNDIDLLVRKLDINNLYNIEYKYDDALKLIEEADSRGISYAYRYNNEDKLIYKIIEDQTRKFITSYSYNDRTYYEGKKGKYDKLKHLSNSTNIGYIRYFGFFQMDNNLEYEYGEPFRPIKNVITPVYGSNIPRLDSVNYSYIDTTLSSDFLGYNLNVGNDVESKASIMFWFKPSGNNDDKYILSIGSHANSNSINLKIGNGGGIDLYLSNDSVSNCFINHTNNSVLIDEWNFVGLSWEYICVDNGPEVFNMTINLNGINTNFMTSDGDICYFNSSSPLAVIGGASDVNRNRHSDSFDGLFTSVIAVPNKVLADWEFNEYYRQTKALMFTTDNFDGIISVNAINNYNFGNIITEPTIDGTIINDIIPLNNDLVSFNGVKPKILKQRDFTKYDNDPYFIYDKTINRYVYHANTGELAYEYSFTNKGSLSVNVCFLETNNVSTILELKSQTNFMRVYRDKYNIIHLLVNNNDYETDLIINNNVWKRVSVEWNDESSNNTLFRFDIYVDDIYEAFERVEFGSLNQSLIYVGSDTSDSHNYMYGLVEMLYVSNDKFDSLSQLRDKLKVNTSVQKYDYFGRLKKKEISTDNVKHIQYEYNYIDNVNNNQKRTSTYVKEEVINLNQTQIKYNYVYDKRGNVIEVYGSNSELLREYMYNYKGELTQEDNVECQVLIGYEYNNGNIVSKTYDNYGTNPKIDTYSFEYNNEKSKDILTKVTKNGIIRNVSYTDSYFGNPTNIPINNSSYSLEWTGRRLSKVNISNNEYYEYKYDDQGLRVSKKYVNTVTGIIEHIYHYENNKLVKEVYNDEIIDVTSTTYYGYDENDLLLYIIINDIKYYYIRDIFMNIIGLASENGNLIARYYYDAYGNIINTTGNVSIASSNPYRYKGYYYDVETEFFYCNSRYYSPELCRFINPDSIDYLDPESVNGLNLYCYCMNNPIMNVDSSGHFTIGALIISFFTSVVFEIIEDAMDGELFTDDSHDWKDYLGAGISGILGGMSGSASVLLGLFGDLADAAISGDFEENGFLNTMGSIAVSSIVSIGVGALSKWGFSKMKAKSLRKLGSNNAANRVLSEMGVVGKVGKKSNKALAKMIRESNWIGNIIVEYGTSSIMGGVSSMGWSHIFDGRWF